HIIHSPHLHHSTPPPHPPFFVHMLRPPPSSTLFPYTTLFRSVHAKNKPFAPEVDFSIVAKTTAGFTGADLENLLNEAALLTAREDRKSTRLNSSHVSISYAVFCLKKKIKCSH